MSRPAASHLDVFALAAQAADDVVLGTVREMHDAIAGRVHGGPARWGGGLPALTWWLHSAIAGGVFASVSGGLRLSSVSLRLASRHGARGGDLESSGYGRFLSGAVNGLIGDRLREDDDPVFFEMSVRVRGREVPCDPDSLADAFPRAGGAKVVVFVHGLCETEDVWWRSEVPASPEEGAEEDAEESRAPPRSSYGDRLVEAWPLTVTRLALVGHSMGGLVVRAAGAVSTDRDESWTDVVTDVVCLGTPHHGAPLERVVARGVRPLGRLPESAPIGRILEFRSVGILDLRHGLSQDVQHLPRPRYRLVGATLSRRADGTGAQSLGDLLVPFDSAMGRDRDGTEMFPGAETLHIRGDHFDLLNHREVYAALLEWLADRDDAPTREEAAAGAG